MFRPRHDARILLVVIACLAARATGLTGSAAGFSHGRAWKAAAAGNTPPARSRVAVVSSAGVTLAVDGEAGVGRLGQSEKIYAVSTDAAVTEHNLSVARLTSPHRVPTGWQKEVIGDTGDAPWALDSEVDAIDTAMNFDTLYPAEAQALSELLRKSFNDSGLEDDLGEDMGGDAAEDDDTRSIQWTRRLIFLGLAGIALGLFLPTENGWADGTPSGHSLETVQGDTGSSPAGNLARHSQSSDTPGATPTVEASKTSEEREAACSGPTGATSSETSRESEREAVPGMSAGQELLTINREKSSPIPIEEMSPTLHALGTILVRQKWKVIFIWAVLCLCHVPLAAQIRSIMSLNFTPTPEMPSYEARARFKKQFPSVANTAQFALVLETQALEPRAPPAPKKQNNSDNRSVVVGAPLCKPGPDGRCNSGDCCKHEETCSACPLGFTKENVSARQCSNGAGFGRCKVLDYVQIMEMPGLSNFSVELRRELNASGKLLDFTSLSTAQLDFGIDISSMLIAPAGNVAMIEFRIAERTRAKESQAFARNAHPIIHRLAKEHLPNITFTGLVGVPECVNAAVDSAEKSLVIMDLVTLPVATFLLWWVLRGYRLLVVLLCTMVVSSSCCFGVLFLVGVTSMPVDTLTPELVMSILIAMNIDYALFLNTRFRSEVLDHIETDETGSPQSPPAHLQKVADEATVSMLGSAGFTVMTSGTLLWLVFTSLIYFPLGAVRSIGLGCTICLLFTIAVNVTLVPALLSAFPHFFTGDFLKPGGAPQDEKVSPFDGVWKWMARKTTTFPNNLILVSAVLMFCSGTGVAASRMKVQSAFAGTLPRGSDSAKAVQMLAESYSLGGAVAIEVLLEPAPNTTDGVFSEEFWNVSQDIFHDIQYGWPGGVESTRLHAVSYADGAPISWRVAEVCLRQQKYGGQSIPGVPVVKDVTTRAANTGKMIRDVVQSESPVCKQLEFLRKRYVNAEATATYAHILPAVDPLGSNGQMWLEKARNLSERWEKATGVRVTFAGYIVELEDQRQYVSAMVPIELGVIMSTVLLLGLAFQSALVPLRSILTLLATISVVYGGAVLAFQDGMLDFLGIPGIRARFGGVNWLAPVVCFPICAGICLDYDVFLITRIGEYRSAACSPDKAIRYGLFNTGGIITAAGLIMTTAFSGHIVSDLEGMNSFGFFLVVTVMFDTFVMRPIFTPASMSLIGRYNWWPGSLFHLQELPQRKESEM